MKKKSKKLLKVGAFALAGTMFFGGGTALAASALLNWTGSDSMKNAGIYIDQVTDKVIAVEGEKNTLTTTNKELQKQNEQLSKDKTNLNKEITKLEKEIEKLRAEVDKKQEGSQKKEQQIAELNKQVDELNKQIADINKQIADHNRQIDDLNRQIDDLNEQIDDLNKQIVTKQSDVDYLTEELKKANEAAKTIDGKLNAAYDKLEKAGIDITK